MSNISRKKRFPASGQKRVTHWLVTLCLVFCFPVLATGASLSDSPWELIRNMMHSMKARDYQQTFIYENQSGLSTVKLFHAWIDGHEYERLVFLTGASREFVRKDGDIMALKGALKEHPVFTGSPLLSFDRIKSASQDKLNTLYHFKLQGEERVAGRDAVKLAILPKDRFRYGYLVWMDKKTGIMLRLDLLNENLSTMDRFVVTDFDADQTFTVKDFPWNEESAKSTVSSDPAQKKMIDKAGSMSDFPWKISWVPEGFVADAYGVSKSPVNDGRVNHAFYSDGLSAFSVYVEEDTSRVLNQSAERYGATSAVSRVFKIAKNAYYNVTVIGELPLGAAERIAASVQQGGGLSTEAEK